MPSIDLLELVNLMNNLPPWFRYLWMGVCALAVLLTLAGIIWSSLKRPETATDSSTNSQTSNPIPIGNGISIVNNGTLNLTIQDFGPVAIARAHAVTVDGNADIEFVLLHSSAVWKFNSDSAFVTPAGAHADIERFLRSPEFAERASTYADILCLGTSSSVSERAIISTIPLSRDRAIRLCRMVQTAPIGGEVRVSALGLGYHTVPASKNSTEERQQRAAVLVGVGNRVGDPDLPAIVRQLMVSGPIGGFDFRPYSALQGTSPLIVEQVTSLPVQ